MTTFERGMSTPLVLSCRLLLFYQPLDRGIFAAVRAQMVAFGAEEDAAVFALKSFQGNAGLHVDLHPLGQIQRQSTLAEHSAAVKSSRKNLV